MAKYRKNAPIDETYRSILIPQYHDVQKISAGDRQTILVTKLYNSKDIIDICLLISNNVSGQISIRMVVIIPHRHRSSQL